MMLLSEVADKLRNEILAWPSHKEMPVRIAVSPSLDDARDGSEALLVELLMMPAALLPETASGLDIRISGNRELLSISFNFGAHEIRERILSHWELLKNKAAGLIPRMESEGNQFTLYLCLPSASVTPPVNLDAMARETGIQIHEARQILREFVVQGKTHFDVLTGKNPDTSYDERFRAAHSLKGAGKTLRAPELAAAARALESKIRNRIDSTAELRRLVSAWENLEQWLKEERE